MANKGARKKSGKISTKNSKEKIKDDKSFSSIVHAFGGDAKDIEMLDGVDIDDDLEVIETSVSDVTRPSNNEIASLVASLGLNALPDEESESESEQGSENETMTLDENGSAESNDKREEQVNSDEDEDFTNESTKVSSKAKAVAGLQTEVAAVLSEQIYARYGKDPKTRKSCMFDGDVWHNVELNAVEMSAALEPAKVELIRLYAEKVLEEESRLHAAEQERLKPADMKIIRNFLTSGTLSDKTSTQALMLQESAVHNLKTLRKLCHMSQSKNKRESMMATENLEEAWLRYLLPSDRKLKFFHDQPLASPGASDKHLALWYFEDNVKRLFLQYVGVLEVLSRDQVASIKSTALKTAHALLSEKPEQEKNLLKLIVNKMGDTEKKIASKVVYLLGQVVQAHPNMKLVVAREIEELVYRSNVSVRARYYSVCFLNQIILSHNESHLATTLIGIYLSLFSNLVEKGEVESKLLAALLTGVNRAFPYANVSNEEYNQHIDTLFRIVHVSPFVTSVQALMLLFQVMHSREAVTDRYYRTVYQMLWSVDPYATTRHAAFLNIVYKAVSVDANNARICAFVKRLLQLSMEQEAPFVTAVLFMVSEVIKTKPHLKSMIMISRQRKTPSPTSTDEELVTEKANGIETTDVESVSEDMSVDTSECVDKKVSPKSWVAVYGEYDPIKREPLYAGADTTCLWELTLLARHYHPSVAKFAATILMGRPITYVSDPLADFTLIRFLDKFVYKNAKKKALAPRGASIMQRRKLAVADDDTTSDKFVNRDASLVAPENMFLHRYLTETRTVEKRKLNQKKKNKKRSDDMDDLEIGDDAGDLRDDKLFRKAMMEASGLDGDEGSENEDDDEQVAADSDGEYNYDDLAADNDEEEGEEDMENVDWDAVAMAPSSSEDEDNDHMDDVADAMMFSGGSEDDSDDEDGEGQLNTDSKAHRNVNKKKKEKASVFGDADDFAQLLENAGESDDRKQGQHERRKMIGSSGNRKRKGSFKDGGAKRGRGGGRGGKRK
eukprot:CFRG0497T1